MTREQDFERRLSEWLDQGPSRAPDTVVDEVVGQTRGRPQRHGVRRWFERPAELLRRARPGRLDRLMALAAVLAVMLVSGALLTRPFDGRPAVAPVLDPTEVGLVAGTSTITDVSTGPASLVRAIDIDVGDSRIDGEAVQELELLLRSDQGMSIARGTMRLENAWGTWEGPVEVVGYPTGEEVEVATLTGSGAYDGYAYHYAIHSQPAGTERAFEGAIWPDEPPSMPDPSLLP